MKKRPAAQAAIAFLLGTMAALTKDTPIVCGVSLVMAAVEIAVCSFLLRRRIKTYLYAGVLSVIFLFGTFHAYRINSNLEQIRTRYSDNERIVFEGKVFKKEEKNNNRIVYLKNCNTIKGFASRTKVYLPENRSMPCLGSYIYGSGEVLSMHRAENEGGFDEEGYNTSLGISLKIISDKIIKEDAPVFSLRELLYDLRNRIILVYKENLHGEEPEILGTMVLGNRSEADDEAEDLFREAGLSHIFAISGIHISVVGMCLYEIMRKRFFAVPSSAVAVIGVMCYAVMSGGLVSALRAVGMFFIWLLSGILGEEYDTASSLAVMSIITLLLNPLSIFSVSFVFSFGAVLGILVVANVFSFAYREIRRMKWEEKHRTDRGRRWRMRPLERAINALIFSFGIFVSTLPVTAYYFYAVPLYVILLNIIVLPFLGVLLFVGLFGGICGVMVPVLGKMVGLCHFIIYYYELAADVTSKLPMSSYYMGRPYMACIIIYYMVIYLIVFALKKWLKAVTLRFEERNDKGGMNYGAIKTASAVLVICALAILVLDYHRDEFEIDMLSVGQGDGIFIDSGMGKSFFIDGGSTSSQQVGKYVMLPFLKSKGIGHIDGWFLTHMDKDHVNGFEECLEKGYRVDNLFLAKALEKNDEYFKIKELCIKSKVNIIYMELGQAIDVSSIISGGRRFSIECIFPESPSEFEGTNENSLVLHLKYATGGGAEAFDGIFTGDIGSDQEKSIIEYLKGCENIELLKSAHHGSNNSNCSEWLGALLPDITIISAGRNNLYGHPGRKSIERMDELGLKHMCTIDCGQIKVRWHDGGILVETLL